MEAFLAKVAQATKSPPPVCEPSSSSTASRIPREFVSSSSAPSNSCAPSTSGQTTSLRGGFGNANGFSQNQGSRRNEHGGFAEVFKSGITSPALELRESACSRAGNNHSRLGQINVKEVGETVPIEEYLRTAQKANSDEIANLENLSNSHGTIFEARSKAARVVIQGYHGLVFLDEETFQDGESLRGRVKERIKVGDCMDVVTCTRSEDVRFCTGVTTRSSSSAICGDEYAIITQVLDNCAGAIALNVTSEKVLILNEALPHDEPMEMLDRGTYIDWDTTLFPLPKLANQSWLEIGRTLRVQCIPTPLWLREQLQQFGPGGPCAKLALRVVPYGEELTGKGRIFKLLETGGVLCSDSATGTSREIYFSKYLVCKGGENEWEEAKKALIPGTEMVFVACQEIPARAYSWRALKMERADAENNCQWTNRILATSPQKRDPVEENGTVNPIKAPVSQESATAIAEIQNTASNSQSAGNMGPSSSRPSSQTEKKPRRKKLVSLQVSSNPATPVESNEPNMSTKENVPVKDEKHNILSLYGTSKAAQSLPTKSTVSSSLLSSLNEVSTSNGTHSLSSAMASQECQTSTGPEKKDSDKTTVTSNDDLLWAGLESLTSAETKPVSFDVGAIGSRVASSQSVPIDDLLCLEPSVMEFDPLNESAQSNPNSHHVNGATSPALSSQSSKDTLADLLELNKLAHSKK